MKRLLFSLLVFGALLPAIASADDANEEAIKKDRERIQGLWRVVALVIDGNEAAEEDGAAEEDEAAEGEAWEAAVVWVGPLPSAPAAIAAAPAVIHSARMRYSRERGSMRFPP